MDLLPETATHILIVDDDPTNIELLFRVLDKEEFDIVVANSGEQALEYAHEDPPELILLDLRMPGIDGLEVCRRLKDDAVTRSAPVIFMTAHADLERRMKAFELGAADFIRKPFDIPELVARIRTQLSVRDMMRLLQQKNERLEQEMRERAEEAAQREQLTRDLLRRTEELRQAKEQIEAELAERGRIEQARNALQERVIAVQRQRLAELSTPLIPITQHIIVMPFIGIMDVERMQQVMDSALRGARERDAEFVILDITGMQDVEPVVVTMLVQIGNALRLLGTRIIITGIGAEVASRLVMSNISLGSLVTKATLQDGITYAMRAQSAGR